MTCGWDELPGGKGNRGLGPEDRTGQRSRTEKITEMPSWIFCNIGLVNTALHPHFLPPHVYILTVLHLITLVSDTVLSLAAFSGGTCNVFYRYINIYKYIYEYKSNCFWGSCKKKKIQSQGKDVWISFSLLFFYFCFCFLGVFFRDRDLNIFGCDRAAL